MDASCTRSAGSKGIPPRSNGELKLGTGDALLRKGRSALLTQSRRSSSGLLYVPPELAKKINKACPPRPLVYRDGDIVFAQNDHALNQYKIIRGAVTVHVGHLLKKVATLGVNEIFGTLGPASPEKKRTATVVALGETHLLVRSLDVHHTSSNKSNSPRPAFTVEEKVYKRDDVIVKQGAIGKSFFVIQSGSVNVTVNVDNDSQETVKKIHFE